MSHLTYTPEEYDKILKSEENPFVKNKTLPEKIQTVTTKVVERTSGFVEILIELTIVGWYFFFTGLALLCGRRLPKEWLRIATRLEKGTISRKVKDIGLKIDLAKSQPQKLHKKYKVVDLDTHKAVNLPRTS